MDSGVHQLAQRRINHPLPFDTVLSFEGGTLDGQREVALACRIVAAVATMLLAVVAEFDRRRLERRVEAARHFGRDRSGSLSVHCPYIAGFDGDEAIQDARTGRRGEG